MSLKPLFRQPLGGNSNSGIPVSTRELPTKPVNGPHNNIDPRTVSPPAGPIMPFSQPFPDFNQHTGDGMDSVQPNTAFDPNGVTLPAQSPHSDLAAIRMAFPFLEIMPFPAATVEVFLVGGILQDLSLPEGAVLVQIAGNGDYWISHRGAAAIPDGVTNKGSIFKPENKFFYCSGIRQISAIAANAVIVQAYCWFAPRWPTPGARQ